MTFSDDTKSPIVTVGRRIILAMGGEILVAHDKAGVQFLRQTRAAGSVVQATREPDLCDGYHRPLMAQQLAFHRKLKCAHCWGKRHGEYHNDHCLHACGSSCFCRSTLVRVGTRMTIAEIAILNVMIAVVVVSVWLGFRHREF